MYILRWVSDGWFRVHKAWLAVAPLILRKLSPRSQTNKVDCMTITSRSCRAPWFCKRTCLGMCKLCRWVLTEWCDAMALRRVFAFYNYIDEKYVILKWGNRSFHSVLISLACWVPCHTKSDPMKCNAHWFRYGYKP